MPPARVVTPLVAAVLALTAAIATAQPPVDARLTEAIGWYTGVAGRVDDAKARALVERAAADGDVLARMWVARAHSRGRMGFPRDDAKARAIAALLVEAVRRQAEQSSVEAMFLIGTACDEGLGVAEDPVQALAWFRKAAATGHTLAEHNIGNAYAAGRGVARDDAAAVAWWLKAGQKGDAVPQFRLGDAYEHGTGVAANLAEARRWYAASAARGHAPAAAALRRMSGLPPGGAGEPRPR